MGICIEPWSIGVVVPRIGSASFGEAFFATAFVGAVFLTADSLAEALFFAGVFFAGGFSGIGMVMPGMRCCADAGAANWASVNALAVMSNLFT